MKKSTKQHDAPESPAATEKRLGIESETRMAVEKYATDFAPCDLTPDEDHRVYLTRRLAFSAGVRWERRRRAKDGY